MCFDRLAGIRLSFHLDYTEKQGVGVTLFINYKCIK